MNFSTRILPFIFSLPAFYLVLSSTLIEADSQQEIETYTIDHNKDREKAKKWSEKQYTAWKKTLTSAEKNSLKRLLQPPKENEENNLANINHQLQVYGGDLSARPIDTPVENKNLQDHINRIKRSIKRKEGKLEKPLIVYKNETLQQALHVNDQSFLNSDNTLDEGKVSQLKEDFSAGLHSEFRIFDLFEDPNKNKMLKWKIELPAGTQTGLITENKIVIAKDSAFKVTAVKIIVEKGKQLIRIEAKIIPKETVTHEIKQLTDHLQQDFNARLHLPLDKKFLDFKLTGLSSYVIAKNLAGLMDKFIRNINSEISKKMLLFMSETQGYITLTDQELYTLPIVYEPEERTLVEIKEMMDVSGYYNRINRTLSVNLLSDMKKNLKGEPGTLFHEFGHAIDTYCAHILQLPEDYLSDMPEFTKIFEKEGKNLTEYGSTNSRELFAEAFWMIHTTEHLSTVQEKAPETYAFIKKTLNDILKVKSRAIASPRIHLRETFTFLKSLDLEVINL